MSHVFISYKREDIDRVGPLVDALRASGLDVWWDQDIPPGGSWRETIVEKLDGSALCVAVWSEHSVGTAGRFVREEAERSARREAYLGVLIDPVPPPFGFSEWQAIDMAEWDGGADDPQLRYLVDTVKAKLAGAPPPAQPRPAPRRRKAGAAARMKWGIAAAGLVAVMAVALLVWRPWTARLSPTDFVNAELARIPCTWAEISGVSPTGPDGVAVKISGVSAAPGSIATNLLREAEAQGIDLASVDAAAVAAAPQAVCAELQDLAPYREVGRQHLTVMGNPAPPIDMDGPHLKVAFNVDTDGLPAYVAILGLDTSQRLHVAVEDLRRQIADFPPPRREGSKVGYDAYFPVPSAETRSLGLILMTSNAPINFDLVSQIGRTTDRARLKEIEDAARAGNWRFELGVTTCGFAEGDAAC